MMKRSSFLFVAVLSASLPLCSTLWAQAASSGDPPTSQSPITDQDFFTRASRDGVIEVQMGQLAEQRASSPGTRALAEQLVRDHTAANKELAALAVREHDQVAQQPPDSALMERLQSLHGDAFDQAYASAMVGGHQKAIELFDAAAHSSDPQVKAFATKTLPTLRHHLQMAQALTTKAPLGTP